MYDVITIGSAFRDVYVFSKKFRVLKDSRSATGAVECFAFGTKIELDDILFEIGGGATNTAFTFSKQGLKVGCLSRIGNDGAGQEVKNFLKHEKIGDLLITDNQSRTAHSVVFLTKNGERTILVYRGAAHKFHTKEIKFNKIANTKWLYITSLAGNVALLEKIVNFAKKKKIKLALNPGKLEIKSSKQRLARIFKHIDILFLNREEAVLVNKRSFNDDKGILNDIRRICPGIIVVTGGSSGCIISIGDQQHALKIKPVKAKDTTGAGDAFGSGFLAGYMKSKGDPILALQLAIANSAAVVTEIGAKHGLLSKNSRWVNSIKKIHKIV